MALHLTKTGESTIINHNRQIMSRNLYPKRNSYIKERGTIIMTKIKNTKKGMAKKTLSMSLVVAMLATSNVPVWAAEFSDGTDATVATEAPAEFADEAEAAPVVEDAAEVADVATATAPTLNLTDWNSTLSVSGDIKDENTDVTSFNYKVRIDGKEVVGHDPASVYAGSASSVATLNTELAKAKFAETDAGHTVSVDIVGTGNFEGFKTTIAGIEIKSVDVSTAKLNLNGQTVSYTGKQVAFTDEQIKNFTFSNGLSWSDFTYTYEGDDLVNATPSGKNLYVVATVNKAGYTGKIKATFTIAKRTLDAGKLEVKLNKNTVSYAEKAKISSDYVSVKDTVTGETLPASVYSVTATGLNTVGAESVLTVATDSLSKDAKTNSNYQGNVSKITTEKVKVVANQMSDFKIVVDSIGKDYVTDTNSVKAAIHFYLGDKEVTSSVADAISVKPAALASDATTLSVAVNGDNKNVIGNTTVTLPVTLNKLTAEGLTYTIGSLKDQKANATTDLGAETYTGAAITKNIKDVRFVVTGTTTTTTVNLSSSDYKVEYVNDNTNAQAVSGKNVDVYIVGTGNYSGRVKIGSFAINAAEITAADITVPAKVQYDGSLQTVADYMTGKVTVKAGATGKKKDVPADAYKLTYATKDGKAVAVGSTIVTTLKKSDITNKNYTITGDSINAAKETAVTNKDIADTNVKVEVVGGPYAYTGKAITPNIKVAVDGVELAKDIDYTIKSCTNNVNAGEATVTVEGKGDYSGTQTVKFTINKANLSDVKVEANTKDHKNHFTYTGSQVKPTASDFNITLNGVKLNAADFVVTYPTTSKVNVNAGDAKVTIAPVKSNTNFTGDKMDVNFKILPAEITGLDGNFYAFDENGDKIDFTTTAQYVFGYDGTEKTFKDIKFVPTTNTNKLVEGKDYEIKYFNNVTGPEAYVYINGIGNYTNPSTNKFSGSDKTYVVKQEFGIEGVTIGRKNVSVSDTEYAGGVAVTPNVTIKVGEKTLVEGTDYEFTVLKDNVNVTPETKVLTATLKLKGNYNFDNKTWTGVIAKDSSSTKEIKVTWKVVKKDLANTTVSVVKNGAELKATVLNGNVIVPESEYDVKDNGDGTATVTAKSTSKNYTGNQKVDVKEGTKVGAPVISGVKVVGNKATVILSGEADGASGYDYVFSKANDTTTARVDVTKNQVKTTGDFNYVQQGTYYAYCHAWTRDAEGKKVFGEWSNIYPFSVSAITPAQPVITSVTAKGTTVTVTYTKAANAEGYDVVLGSAAKKVNGEYRPVEYGKLIKKNIKGNVVTATFKNVKKGTYYAGLHAFNKTSEDGKKVFSQWSNVKKVTVK